VRSAQAAFARQANNAAKKMIALSFSIIYVLE
jgi:hypothetical protein